MNLITEYKYFLSIKRYILYIIKQNSIDSKFDNCNFALELLGFFTKLFKTNIKYYSRKLNCSKEFKIIENEFKEKYWNYGGVHYLNLALILGLF